MSHGAGNLVWYARSSSAAVPRRKLHGAPPPSFVSAPRLRAASHPNTPSARTVSAPIATSAGDSSGTIAQSIRTRTRRAATTSPIAGHSASTCSAERWCSAYVGDAARPAGLYRRSCTSPAPRSAARSAVASTAPTDARVTTKFTPAAIFAATSAPIARSAPLAPSYPRTASYAPPAPSWLTLICAKLVSSLARAAVRPAPLVVSTGTSPSARASSASRGRSFRSSGSPPPNATVLAPASRTARSRTSSSSNGTSTPPGWASR